MPSLSSPHDPSRIALIIAVKRLGQAKTRLGPTYSGAARESLVLAMLADTIYAAMAATDSIDGVTVTTPDITVARAATGLGARVLFDRTPTGHDDALNAALTTAAEAVCRRSPNVAVLQGDLPALRTEDLVGAIRAARAHRRSFVADRHATGTAALFAFGVALGPVFGPDSAQRHTLSGATSLDGEWPGLRCDVDTPEDMTTARRLGLGQATRHTVELIEAEGHRSDALAG